MKPLALAATLVCTLAAAAGAQTTRPDSLAPGAGPPPAPGGPPTPPPDNKPGG